MALAKRWAISVLLAVSLSSCGTVYESDSFWKQSDYWQAGKSSDAAMAALAKGDLVRAEAEANDAMRRNPKDPYALLALAVVYQNTNRLELARQYYEVLVSMHPQAIAIVGAGMTGQPRTIDNIAKESLAALNGRTARGYVDPPGQPGQLPVPPPPAIDAALLDPAAVEDANIILRFQTLRRLLDDGLITRDEYNLRRGANLGALLRYTAPPPAQGLGRPAPTPEQIVDRLKALAFGFEEKSISAAEQAAERSVILEALIPAVPQRRANPPVPVTSQMQSAAVMGRLEKLREANVITPAEQSRERDAVFRSVIAYEEQAAASARAAAGMMAAVSSAPTGPGVQLASFHTAEQARKHWAALQKLFPTELGALMPVITKVALRHRGSLYRLNAGPVADRKAALALCGQIKRKHQSCVPTVLK
ncbi:MAG TPA: SPOR domain-containing protein [Patescibacteria group bacterium]|nr:SPOR domain-containing protein [Patescibacteria group bacterium]